MRQSARLIAATLACGLAASTPMTVWAQAAPAVSAPAAAFPAVSIPDQKAANANPGPRRVPAKQVPVPTADVSTQEQALIGAPYPPYALDNPSTPEAWKTLIQANADRGILLAHHLEETLRVTVTPVTIAGVKAYTVNPPDMPDINRNRLLVHVHGGGYVFGPGEAALPEAILMAGLGGFRVISIDYRMPPDAPYPAAMDDAIAVYRELLKSNDPYHMAIFGTSTGGGMTLAMVLRAKAEGLGLPGAIAPGTPWSDLTDTGDSYRANEWLDNVLVSWSGWLGRAALLYANGRDLHDPQLSPIYGDFTGFPPAILTTGTRDLFLSNTVRTHRKLRRAGVEAELNVYEGMSHAQYLFDVDAPETKEAFADIARFFDRHLAR